MLGRAFEDGRVSKEYGALVVGRVERSGIVDAPLDGLESRTIVEAGETTPCAVDGVLTTLSLRPVTGRRHQLRRHCAEALDAPILGDDLHCSGVAPRKGIGLFLYCRSVAFEHPSEDARTIACAIDEPRRFARHRDKARRGFEWERERICT